MFLFRIGIFLTIVPFEEYLRPKEQRVTARQALNQRKIHLHIDLLCAARMSVSYHMIMATARYDRTEQMLVSGSGSGGDGGACAGSDGGACAGGDGRVCAGGDGGA